MVFNSSENVLLHTFNSKPLLTFQCLNYKVSNRESDSAWQNDHFSAIIIYNLSMVKSVSLGQIHKIWLVVGLTVLSYLSWGLGHWLSYTIIRIGKTA